ncbi:beta-galactosidase-like [Zingiber officinale]|uniref:beta-galactosidase-like n=1 Tax=Zingiber officinale TaxID=94328 RepID=UPI001C4CE556|nr:beta-galactosidase-like [Zingiber officinale]
MSGGVTLLLLLIVCFLISSSLATNVTYDGRAIIINGERRVLISGSIHYPRSTPDMWPGLIQKAKEGGLDAIETYIFWNAHEPTKREYNFNENLDFIKFIKIVQDAGLFAILRIGPYVCAEWNYGGFPVWLHQIPGVEMRTDNEIFKAEMQNFTTLIVNMVKNERLFASQGGPIIIAQIENEYGNIMDKYGSAGKRYIQWCANLAETLNIGVPWIMCQQADAPPPMINTCNGFYCDKFTPNRPTSPKMWTENWTGWFQDWGQSKPHRPVEDIAYAVANFFASGGTLQNYYMYHGGTNFGRTSGGPYIVTSYDYDAPLDEYGNIRQPKWGHLEQLHNAIKVMEKVLVYGVANTTNLGAGLTVTKYIANGISDGCFLINANQSTDTNLTYNGKIYFVPSKSISVLPNCEKEVYNTAKVNAPTTLIVTKPTESIFNWQWRPETLTTIHEKGSFSNNSLLEQILTTGDTSDFLWYMTRIDLNKFRQYWSKKMKLHVNTKGHIIHAFVNKHFIGSQYAVNGVYEFVFEHTTKMRKGHNYIALLSSTNGLANYGAYFDLQRAGIDGGPVNLIGYGNATINLTSNTWTYKIGLNGEDEKLYLPSQQHSIKWFSGHLPINRPLIWYKTIFEVPEGNDALVLDLQGMGKGYAWVNGHSIGRYWPSFIADDEGCGPCDYRHEYDSNRCRTDCGKPSQRWYHVPRYFTIKGPNTLILFEEFGGDISKISLQKVSSVATTF